VRANAYFLRNGLLSLKVEHIVSLHWIRSRSSENDWA